MYTKGPYYFIATQPVTDQTTYSFCLTEQRAILSWESWVQWNYYVGTLGVSLMHESVNQIAHTSFQEGVGSTSLQTEGPGYFFLEIELSSSAT